MEAIKCPNCGSEKVKGLTEEKYMCLACENVFLIHNLSKEFRKTDEHISEIHHDISQKINEIKEVSKNSSAEEIRLNAEDELLHGDFLKSYQEFKKYSLTAPTSSLGYEGMYRALTDDYRDDAGEYKTIDDSTTMDNLFNCLYDGFDSLRKALECEDCKKDELISKTLMFYKRSAESLLSKYLFDEKEDNLRNSIEQSIKSKEEQKKDKVSSLEFNKNEIEEYESLSKKELAKKRGKALIPLLVVVLLSIFLWKHIGWFLRIIDIVVLIITSLFSCGMASKPSNLSGFYNREIDELQNQIDFLREAIILLDKIEALDKKEMESMICNECNKGISVEQLYLDYLEIRKNKEMEEKEEEERQAELQEGYYLVKVTNWGKNAKSVRDLLFLNCSDQRYVKETYKNRSVCIIYGFRKTPAYNLQNELICRGASAFVCKMTE